MKTKQDFQQAIAEAISDYPTASQFYQAQDPRLLAQLNAMATMLAMASAEMDVAAMEPWTKARDVSVLADAAVKGVLPFGTPARLKVAIANSATTALEVATGRVLLDTQGRRYVVDTGAIIPAGGAGYVTAKQQAERSITHTVVASRPFYRIDLPAPEEGRYIAAVALKDAAGNVFRYTPDFVNVDLGERVFHLETDENRQLYLKMGASDIAGYQPATGEKVTITLTETEGAMELAPGSPFSLGYGYSLSEAGASLTLEAVLVPGAAPMDITTMREVISYPSIYDSSAVYLGNFDFLVRRQLAPLRFLSIWNEWREEQVRGPNQDNINTLFVAAQKDGVTDAALRDQITAVIKAADDSYRIKWVALVNRHPQLAITAKVPSAYDFAAIAQQIREVVLAEYGQDSAWAKRGQGRILYKRVYDLVVKAVPALQDVSADLVITINDPDTNILPEHYRFVTTSSLTVAVEQA